MINARLLGFETEFLLRLAIIDRARELVQRPSGRTLDPCAFSKNNGLNSC